MIIVLAKKRFELIVQTKWASCRSCKKMVKSPFFVENDHRSYQLDPQMYDITDVAGHEMSSIFISVWVKIRHAITVDS